MQYTELHLHSGFSLLDGLNNADEYMERAKALGMTHISLTDHGVLSGHREFQRAAKDAGITPILGCEMYISETDRFDRRSMKKRGDNTKAFNHLIVLAQNEEGLRNLHTLSRIAWTEGFYSRPRIDMEVLEEYNEGLIVTSGCMGGMISKAIENDLPVRADQLTSEFARIFGDRFFMEIQQHNPDKLNDGLIALARKHGVKPVLTSDCHYANPEDEWLEQAFLIISANPNESKDFDYKKAQKMDFLDRFDYAYPGRTMDFRGLDLFLHGAEDHLKGQLVGKYGEDFVRECIDNTMIVAGMVEDYPYYEGLDLLPRPKTGDPAEALRELVLKGAAERGTLGVPEYDERREEELSIILPRFPEYFIIEGDAVRWAKDQGIRIGPGRGSGAGCLVNYELGVTNVDPIKHNLLFFRFINPERGDYPDIDTDVEDRRRSEVKAYLTREYKHVASIATFGTFQGKVSVRDAARVFMVPLGEVNKALKGADWLKNWWEEWEKTQRGKDFSKKYPEVIKLAKYLFGRKRSQGMHAGGIVMSNEPIEKYAPIQTAKDGSDESGARIPLIALDMEEAEKVGFIKYDWLGLKALTIVEDTVNMIKARHGKYIDTNALPLDDKRVYRTLSQGYTKGVFQCEATPYTNLIIDMGGVANFDELVASNALVRPGAADSSAGKAFVERKEGRAMVEYHHPDMVWFTRETYGAIIYQEQVMLTMTELAGMSMGTADKVRKIIGKKKDVHELDQYRQEFIDGASDKISVMKAEALWHDFEAHANYSFNKSHAVGYSLLSYQMAWLKEYYPIEFMTAVLSNEKDKDSMTDYMTETKRLGIRVLLPHVNASGIDFEIQSDERGEFIRMGLKNIKYISGKIGHRLLENRPFESYAHLAEVTMTKGSGITTRTLQALNAIGGAAFPDNPRKGNERENFYEYLRIPAFETKQVPPTVKATFRTLDEYDPKETFLCMGMVRDVKTGPGWARLDIVDELGSAGIFTDEHTQIESGRIYILLVSNNRVARYIALDDFDPDLTHDFTEFVMAKSFPDVPEGMYKVIAFKSRMTKADKKMAHVVLTDEHKNLISAMVFPTMFVKAFAKMGEGKVVDAKLERTKDGALFIDNLL